MTVRTYKQSKYSAEGFIGNKKWRAVKTPSDQGSTIYRLDGGVMGFESEELEAIKTFLTQKLPNLI